MISYVPIGSTGFSQNTGIRGIDDSGDGAIVTVDTFGDSGLWIRSTLRT